MSRETIDHMRGRLCGLDRAWAIACRDIDIDSAREIRFRVLDAISEARQSVLKDIRLAKAKAALAAGKGEA